MIDLKLSNHSFLALDHESFKEALETPDGFRISVEIDMSKSSKINSNGPMSDKLYLINKPRHRMVFTQECVFETMKREIFEEIGLDLTAIECDIKHFGYDKKILIPMGSSCTCFW